MLTEDQTRILTGILFSIILSFPLRYLPSNGIKSLYSLSIGLYLQYYAYGHQIILPFLQHLTVYAFIKINGRNSGAFITIYSVCSLFVYHIYRMIVDYGGWKLDVSTILMMMVCKYSMIAYAYQDGQYTDIMLSQQQARYKLSKFPNLYDFLGYCYFLPTSIIGIGIEYKHYQQYMNDQNPYDSSLPINYKIILFEIFRSGIFFVIYAVGLYYFPIITIQQAQFANNSSFYVLAYSQICVTLAHFKYFFGWSLCLAALDASGISYNQQTGRYDKIEIFNAFQVQSSPSMRNKIQYWNMTVQSWLRRCVYMRLPFQKKSHKQFCTFLVSAFWHGCYGGYYIAFSLWFLLTYLDTLLYRQKSNSASVLLNWYEKTGIIGKILVHLIGYFYAFHFSVYFMVLSLRQCLRIAGAVYYGPFIILLLFVIFFRIQSTFKRKTKNLSTKQKNLKKS